MPTIYDVAREAKVSIGTVSAALSGALVPRVSEAKKREIQRITERMGYVPHGVAKALSAGSTRIVGLIVPMPDPIFLHPFIAEVLSGIQDCMMEKGYHLMIYSHTERIGRISRAELQQSRFVDGVIVVNTRMSSQQDMRASIGELQIARIPFVMVNGYSGSSPINYVGVDDVKSALRGGLYLISRGHSRIGLLTGTKRSPISSNFLAGFKKALRQSKLPFDPELYAACEYSESETKAAIARWMSSKHPPTAIFCADDQFIPGVYAALRRYSLSIPRDVAVLARGSSLLADSLSPKLSTLTVPGFKIGIIAGKMLIDILQNGASVPPSAILSCVLTERESC